MYRVENVIRFVVIMNSKNERVWNTHWPTLNWAGFAAKDCIEMPLRLNRLMFEEEESNINRFNNGDSDFPLNGEASDFGCLYGWWTWRMICWKGSWDARKKIKKQRSKL